MPKPPAFDLDRRLCEVTRPSFVYLGYTYVGCLPSFEQATAWGARLHRIGVDAKAGRPGVDGALRAVAIDMAASLFPDPPPKRWGIFPRPMVADVLARPAVDTGSIVDAIESFSAALATMRPATGPQGKPGPMSKASSRPPKKMRSARPQPSADAPPTPS